MHKVSVAGRVLPGIIMQSTYRIGLGLVIVVVALLALVLAEQQRTPVLEVNVDLGFGPASSATPAPAGATPLATPSAEAMGSPAAAPPPTLPAPLGAIITYTIRPGDNLSIIAARYATTVEAIRARNPLGDPNLLFVGAPLQIKVGEQAPSQGTALPGTSAPLTAVAVAAGTPAAPTPAPLTAPAVPAAMDALVPTRPAQAPAAYTVYIPTASKTGQWFHFTCEFDAAWAILKTYGVDASLDDQLQIIGVDTSVEPTYQKTDQGAVITGGDIAHYYSGNYETNFLARTTGAAMTKIFAHYGFATTPVHDQAGVEAALQAGQLVWIKTTVDFQRWVPATWVGPDGQRYQTVLGNDHAVVVAGYNADAVLIRDVLGPTSTNTHRLGEYEVEWPTFLAAWGAQSNDGLAVARGASPP